MNLRPEDAARLAGDLLDLETHHGTDSEGLVGVPASGVHSLPGGRLGNYRIMRLGGRGGMGEVYEAEQENPKRRVALKVVRASLLSSDLRRRFEHEVRILGSLQHPGIAQIYEAGQFGADGSGGEAGASTPFFAMEYVEGEPLTKYASARTLGVKERLELFLRVCQAVEHAHQRGIIHRDLKPANILVATPTVSDTKSGSSLVDQLGQPKVLDFGVARATDADVTVTSVHTEIGKLVGTLPYMSPEQASGNPDDLDTRSDVYALGVVLYELLSGKLPYEVKGDGGARVAQALRVIKEVDPTPLSSIDRVFRGDLETIVGKALEKERERRYQSVGELAGDIRRYLDDEPIVARRASGWYELRKFASRNRPMCAAGATVVVGLMIATAVSVEFARSELAARKEAEGLVIREAEATRQANESSEHARKESEISKSALTFVKKFFMEGNPRDGGSGETTMSAALERATAAANAELGNEPEVESSVRQILAAAYLGLGRRAEALREIERVVEITSGDGFDNRFVANVLASYGKILRESGRAVEAEAPLREAVERLENDPGAEPLSLMEARHGLVAVLVSRSRYQEAHELLVRTKAQAAEVFGEESGEMASLLVTETIVFQYLAEFEKGAEAGKRAVELSRARFGEDSYETVDAISKYGAVLLGGGRSKDAESVLEEAWERKKALLGEAHPESLRAASSLATCKGFLRKYTEAEPIFVRTLELAEAIPGANPGEVLSLRQQLANAYREMGKWHESEKMLRAVYLVRLRDQGEDSPSAIHARLNLCETLKLQQSYAEAVEGLQDTMERSGRVLGARHPTTFIARQHYLDTMLLMGRWAEIQELAREHFELSKARFGETNDQATIAATLLARARMGAGELGEAERLLEETIEAARTARGDRPALALAMQSHAECLKRSGNPEKAAQVMEDAAAMAARTFGPDHYRTREIDVARKSMKEREPE